MSINIKPINVKEYTCKQSKYQQVPKLPLRSIVLGPSGSGKGILLQNMILNIYRGCHERVFIFSPSINVDQTWEPVKKYQRDEMGVDDKKEKLYFDTYNPDDLQNIIDTQRKVILKLKKEMKSTKLFSILIIIDDMADNEKISRHSSLLHSLFTRGRHDSISCICSVQKYTSLAQIIRVNATSLICYRLRNYKDLEAVLDENAALVDRKILLEIYHLATHEPYSFLYINLTAPSIKNMFFKNFNQKIEVEE